MTKCFMFYYDKIYHICHVLHRIHLYEVHKARSLYEVHKGFSFGGTAAILLYQLNMSFVTILTSFQISFQDNFFLTIKYTYIKVYNIRLMNTISATRDL